MKTSCERQASRLQPGERYNFRVGTDSEIEDTEICIAQILLRSVPIGSLSFLIDLLGFFTQRPLFPDNWTHFKDIASILGRWLLGLSTKAVSGKKKWSWTRWPQI
jgi:hypothetical protein